MFWFKKKKKLPEKNAGKVALGGQELYSNPPPSVTLTRMKARLKRVNIWLASDKAKTATVERKEHFKRAKKLLEAQIAMKEAK